MNWKSGLLWVGSVLLLLVGLLSLFSLPPVGIVLLLAGLYLFPAVQFDFQLGEALFWLGGLALILLGLLFLSETRLGGGLGVLAGLLALPPVRDLLTGQLDLDIGRGVTAGVVLLVAGAAVGIVYVEQQQSQPPEIESHEMGEQFSVEGTTSTVAFTVEDVRTVPTLRPAESEGTGGKTYILVVVEMENTGTDPVTVWKDDMVVVTEDDEVYTSATEVSSDVPSGNTFTGMTLGEASPRVEPSGTLRRTYVFEADQSGTYLFKISTGDQFSSANHHYVPLGQVKFDGEQ